MAYRSRALSTPFTAIIITSLITMTGCVSHRAEPLPQKDLSVTENSERHNGLIVGAILDGSAEISKYYDRDLIRYGVLPIRVTLSNTSEELDYEFSGESVTLSQLDEDREFKRITPTRVRELAGRSQWSSFFSWLLILPGIFHSSSIVNANTEMLEDFQEKELSNRVNLYGGTPSSKEGVTGVVFFELGKDFDVERLSRDFELKYQYRELKDGKGTFEDGSIPFSQ